MEGKKKGRESKRRQRERIAKERGMSRKKKAENSPWGGEVGGGL